MIEKARPDFTKEKSFIKYCIKLKKENLCDDEWGFGGMIIRDTELKTLEFILFFLEESER